MKTICDDYNIQNILIMVITLMISEILPFIKQIKSNGILELLYNIIYKYANRLSGERQPLLHNIEHIEHIEHSTDQNNIIHDSTISVENNGMYNLLERKMSELNTNLDINFQKISSTMVSYVTELQNTRQLKLHPAELYELNYFINYIKVNYPKKIYHTRFLSKTNKQLLISQGYIIDYDIQNDTHVIKW